MIICKSNQRSTIHDQPSASQRLLIYPDRAIAGENMFNDGFGIVELLQIRQPFLYINSLGIKFFLLQRWIENPEIRRRIATASCRPLPAAIIGGKVIVQQLLREIGFAP